jgi:hypothetical protein
MNSYIGSRNEVAYEQMKMWPTEYQHSSLSGLASQPPRPYERACKHGELISYKVHKDQFKSLLVAPTVRLKLNKEPRKLE